MNYVSVVEDNYPDVAEEIIFYNGQHKNAFHSSMNGIDDLASVYFTIENSMHNYQADKYSGILRAIKDRVDNNLSWVQCLEALNPKKRANMPKKSF